MQNQKKDVDGRTNERTNERTDGVTLSLLELLIAAKNYPKFKSNSKVRIDGIIENESCLPT